MCCFPQPPIKNRKNLPLWCIRLPRVQHTNSPLHRLTRFTTAHLHSLSIAACIASRVEMPNTAHFLPRVAPGQRWSRRSGKQACSGKHRIRTNRCRGCNARPLFQYATHIFNHEDNIQLCFIRKTAHLVPHYNFDWQETNVAITGELVFQAVGFKLATYRATWWCGKSHMAYLGSSQKREVNTMNDFGVKKAGIWNCWPNLVKHSRAFQPCNNPMLSNGWAIDIAFST